MRNNRQFFHLCGVLLLVFAVRCSAAGLPLETLPSNARWVLHLDVKALRESPLGKELLSSLADSQVAAELQAFETATGVDVRRDVYSVVACGIGGLEQGGVSYLRGNWDLGKISTVLADNTQFATAPYGRHTLLSWREAGAPKGHERQSACLVSTRLVLMGDHDATMKQALDTLDGSSAALSTVSKFQTLASLDTNAMLRIMATDLKELVADNPMLAMLPSAESLRLAVSCETQNVQAKAVIKTATREAARQMHEALLGLRVVLMLQGLKNPDIGQLAKDASVEVNGLDVNISLIAPVETVKRLILRKKAAPARHAPQPPTPYPPAS